MSHNISKELARSVAEKRKLEEKRIAERKRSEHGALADKAVGNRKSLEAEINKKSTSDRYFPHLKAVLVVTLIAAFIVIAVGALNKIRVNSAVAYSSPQGLIFNPYKADRKTRDQLKVMENEISEIIEKGASPAISALRTLIIQPFKFDIVSISKSNTETCATVEFVNQETAPVPVIFRWDVNGKFISLKY